MSDTGLPAGGDSHASNNGASNGAGGATGVTTNVVPPSGDALAGTQTIDFDGLFSRLGDSLGTRLDALRQDVGQLPEHLRPPPVEPPAPDYDTMTQSELATHITGSVQKMLQASIQSALQEALGPLAQQLTGLQQTVTTDKVVGEVNQMKSSHKDFSDWKDEMVSLAKTHPTLGVKQLYNLARADNAEKAKQLDTKYNPPAPPPPPRFGGFAPSAPGATGSTPALSRQAAGTEAYREVAARHPGVLAALENL